MGKLEDTCASACALLKELSTKEAPATSGSLAEFRQKNPVSKYMLQGCDSLVFLWSFKAGVLLGAARGSGFIIRKVVAGQEGGAPTWSAPCFVKMDQLQAGLIVGAEKAATILVNTSPSLAERLQAGAQPVLGGDISLQLWPLMTGAQSSYSSDATSLEGLVDTMSVSTGAGVILDLSLKGGVLSVDAAANAECYGQDSTPEALLSGAVPRPPEMQPLYDAISAIIQGRPH